MNSDGTSDKVNITHVFSIEKANYPLRGNEDLIDIRICEPAAYQEGTPLTMREQFNCVIRNSIMNYRNWTDPETDGRLCQTENKEDLCEDKPLKLVFYFNGGLNTLFDVTATAGSTYREIEYDGMYPVYMIWPTGGTDSYIEDMHRVRGGRLTKGTEPSTLATALPWRPGSDLLRGLASTPAAWATSLFEFYQTGFGAGSKNYEMKQDWSLHVSQGEPIALGKTVETKPNQNLYFSPWAEKLRFPERGAVTDHEPVLLDGKPEADLPVQDGAAAKAKQLANVAYHGATAPVRLVTTAPMVGWGEVMWRNMVRRTRTSVRSVAEFQGEFAQSATGENPFTIRGVLTNYCATPPVDIHKLRRCFPRGSGGFALMFQWLESCMTGRKIESSAEPCPLDLSEPDRKTLRNARIVMIGHSMGTIVVNELLQLFPDLPYESLVYMAGAASVRDTSRAVTPVLTRNRGCTRFYGLMLHPMNEAGESNGFGMLPSGSLLVWVDEFLEVPKTVPDRTVGQWRNLRATRHVFPDAARRWMLFRVFDRAQGMVPYGNGKEYPNPTSHGAFNDEDVPFWQEAFWKPEQVKFPAPKADCEAVFASRLGLPAIESGAGTADATTIPADEMARKWPMIWQEVEGGKTVAITSGGHPVARVVPMPEHQEDAALPR